MPATSSSLALTANRNGCTFPTLVFHKPIASKWDLKKETESSFLSALSKSITATLQSDLTEEQNIT